MTQRLYHMIVPVGAGLLGGFFTTPALWQSLSTALTSVVSIISAGILVRLARGVPFSAIDVLETSEANRLAKALKGSIRALRALLLVCFLTILALVFSTQLYNFSAWASQIGFQPWYDRFDTVSFIVSALLTYVLVRTYLVVDGDVQIADIQAEILLKKRGKDKAETFSNDVAKPAKQKYKNPPGYGGAIAGE